MQIKKEASPACRTAEEAVQRIRDEIRDMPGRIAQAEYELSLAKKAQRASDPTTDKPVEAAKAELARLMKYQSFTLPRQLLDAQRDLHNAHSIPQVMAQYDGLYIRRYAIRARLSVIDPEREALHKELTEIDQQLSAGCGHSLRTMLGQQPFDAHNRQLDSTIEKEKTE